VRVHLRDEKARVFAPIMAEATAADPGLHRRRLEDLAIAMFIHRHGNELGTLQAATMHRLRAVAPKASLAAAQATAPMAGNSRIVRLGAGN
jgi:hypothetical protein